MKLSNELKPFMREVLEFISLLRASEKERYETQKKFMTDTIKTLKNIVRRMAIEKERYIGTPKFL